MKKSIFELSTKTIVAIGIGAALYGVLGYFSFPIGPNMYLKPAVAILTILGAMFGPVVGFLVGFIGHAITDMMYGGIWWGWVIASGITGGFMGLVFTRKNFSVKLGNMDKSDTVYLIVMGLLGTVLSWVFAGVFDIYVMGEPSDKMFIQVAGIIVANAIVFLVIGLPAVLGLVKMNKKNSNLTIEN